MSRPLSSVAGDPAATYRIANLDLLRAAAIVLVLLCNAVGKGILEVGAWGGHVLESGWVGVDLFFVLSGWLVGGLYWREREKTGSVEVGRFWARRWLRTVPPYLVALAVVYGIRRAVMGPADSFDVRYLLFAQNYLAEIPYWSVSWSLCVEEHFYLALPLLMGVAVRFRGGVLFALGAVVAVSLVGRLLTVPMGSEAWGIGYTATHLRLEGLALGTAAAWVYHVRPAAWPAVQRVARWAVVPGMMFVAAVPWLPDDILTRVAYTGVDLAFTALLIVVVDRAPVLGATSRAVRWIALTSYATYMTHTVVFDAVRRVTEAVWPSAPGAVLAVGAFAAVGVVSWAFYATVERPTMWIRERVAPRQRARTSPTLASRRGPRSVATSIPSATH